MFEILRETWAKFSKDDCFSEAAALAYFSVLELPPLLVLLISLAGLFYSPADITGRMRAEVEAVVGAGGAEQFRTMLESAQRSNQGGHFGPIIGFIVLLLGASGVMAHLQAALNRIWEVGPDPARGGLRFFLLKRLGTYAMVLGVGFLLIASLVVSSVLTAAGSRIAAWLPAGTSASMLEAVHLAVSLVILTLLFAGMFKWMPDAEVAWRQVWLGALVTACLFTVGKYLIGLYLGAQDYGSAYGSAGSLVLLLVWFYYSGVIFFLGAELIQILACRRSGGVLPSAGAVRVIRRMEHVDREDARASDAARQDAGTDRGA